MKGLPKHERIIEYYLRDDYKHGNTHLVFDHHVCSSDFTDYRGVWLYQAPNHNLWRIIQKKMSAIDEGYVELAIAISTQAALDYIDECHKLKRTRRKSTEMTRIEDFFKSKYGELCTFGKGEQILKLLQEEYLNPDDEVLGVQRCSAYQKITHNGETKTLVEWSKIYNINYKTVITRLRRGYSFNKALTTPVGRKRNEGD